MLCRPSDETKRHTSAGVGIMWDEKVKVVQGEIKTEQLQKAKDQGRVGKYEMDVGWEQHIRIYICYGCAGDTKQATNATAAIIEAIEGEVALGPMMPTLILGGSNHTPCELQSVKKLIDVHPWCNVGGGGKLVG